MAEILLVVFLVVSAGALLLIVYTNDRRLRQLELDVATLYLRLDRFGMDSAGRFGPLAIEDVIQALINRLNGGPPHRSGPSA